LALPGEFTRRAFSNGKMDLAEVEGLADLIDAQTEAQRRQALRQLDGVLGAWVATQRQLLLRALAAAESAIDFSDEGDVAGDFEAEVDRLIDDLEGAVAEQLALSASTARVRDGLVVTLAGPPNAGKSTLLNALARREAAIVSPYAGTTRDPIEVQLDLDGYLVLCIDTAGLRATEDPVEREGVERARARAEGADLVLWLFDARDAQPSMPDLKARLIWKVATKVDLLGRAPEGADYAVAAPTGEGLPQLIAAIRGLADQDRAGGEAGLLTRLRHRRALQEAHRALLAMTRVGDRLGLEIRAEQLRFVTTCLDSLVGRIEPEEVLGEIFARFCVGK
jgi:tRNA modification GTPase